MSDTVSAMPPAAVAAKPHSNSLLSHARYVVAENPVTGLAFALFLLIALAANPKVVLSRRRLIDLVWGSAWVGDERMVDVHVRNLRRKLGDDASEPRFICTVRGAGYRIGSGQ